MHTRELNQVGLQVAEAVSERYGCDAMGFEVGRRDGDSLWVKLTIATVNFTGSEMFKIPLHLANRLTGTQHIQARLELADLMHRSFRNFTGNSSTRNLPLF
jgi:hypothetical protein